MSKAGIQSNRGDGYQTLVAFDWALTVLSDPAYQWMEIDSVTHSVDDIVVGKSNGEKICCQCKKNQPNFTGWSMTDLAGELEKAIRLIASDPSVQFLFYSRSGFGELSALKELSTSFADEPTYRVKLGIGHTKTDQTLKDQIDKITPNVTTFHFLCRTQFNVSPDLERMQTLLRERLRGLVSNPVAAYCALWTQLDHLGMRVNANNNTSGMPRHRLTKDDLKSILGEAGAMLTPQANLVEVRNAFQSTSAVGRAWRRDIGGQRIACLLVDQLITAIEAKSHSILLTGLPGAGKTCVMLALQEKLEDLAKTRSDLLPLFIQSREFADTVTAKDRESQGLPEQWVEKIARMADNMHVVVVIDSLDVLSIAREHTVLTYFLAQIDRLLIIPNVTVITACRDFDRHYDRRIAQRTWSKEFVCSPLDWDTEIAPLLAELNIDASATDATTRGLISNPRELDLFVELAQRGGSFNVVTSQALAQRYLTVVVESDRALGDSAMQAIEAVAAEMLRSRSLAVPSQRFTASQDIRRALLSHNVLREMHGGALAFGHQTLLDILVISGALRCGVGLNTFIQDLPPVPFVRPSIRNFVALLATGDRSAFRKQVRAVLKGNDAFHIRRLVAECLAEQCPLDDDWPLIRDLREHHRAVFQVIYTNALRVEWHYFWNRHLVPALIAARDAEGLVMHVYRASQWKNSDPRGVLAFWMEALAFDWVDRRRAAWRLEFELSDIDDGHLLLSAPLLDTLVNLPRQNDNYLGCALARCVNAGGVGDALLWRYVAGDITQEAVIELHFDNKLRCDSHEFGTGNENFLPNRMQQSPVLLDLAIHSIEEWSQIRRTHFGNHHSSYWSGFLRETSYRFTHSRIDLHAQSSEHILLKAIEDAVMHHAKANSDWWHLNSERLCFSAEGALRYFAIRACTAAPDASLDAIGRMLREKAFLESDLSYELGGMLQASFLQLDPATQDHVQDTVLSIYSERAHDQARHAWVQQQRAQLVATIPSYLRTNTAHAVIAESERERWPLVRQPDIHMSGGTVYAPFSFEIFLAAGDDAMLRLLAHYKEHDRNYFQDTSIGGKREVGQQLHDAASRCPSRFLVLLQSRWADVSEFFCDEILGGIATHLAYRFGNLQPDGSWCSVETPDGSELALKVLDELERHPSHWHHNRAAAKAIQACSHSVKNTQDAGRLAHAAIGFLTFKEAGSDVSDSSRLLFIGINMVRGHVAEALIILAARLQESSISWPELLSPTLARFARDADPAVRAVLLRRLPYLQGNCFERGWELFANAMHRDSTGLWSTAEPCLYYAYHHKIETVALWLAQLHRDGEGKDLETWGRISSLAALSEKIDFTTFLHQLKKRGSADAWRGAASVWTHPENMQLHRIQCLSGLQAGLETDNSHAEVVAHKFVSLFRSSTPLVSLPIELLQCYFGALGTTSSPQQSAVFALDDWLNATSVHEPEQALAATESYLEYVRRVNLHLHDYDNNFTRLLTRLFAQAEEQEELDNGAMLKRVVLVQDALLGLGINGMSDWLKAAERP